MRFNPRSHAGSDAQLPQSPTLRRRFNPRSHAGSDAMVSSLPLYMQSFNPRSHAGSDVSMHKSLYRHRRFNPRSHAGSDLTRGNYSKSQLEFQSTLPRGERLSIPLKRALHFLVSIHAPTRGATMSRFRAALDTIVSIHAPTRGATWSFFFTFLFERFNPRSHAGSDHAHRLREHQ